MIMTIMMWNMKLSTMMNCALGLIWLGKEHQFNHKETDQDPSHAENCPLWNFTYLTKNAIT